MKYTCNKNECEMLYVNGAPIRYCPMCGKKIGGKNERKEKKNTAKTIRR
jgi:hypothetical protein